MMRKILDILLGMVYLFKIIYIGIKVYVLWIEKKCLYNRHKRPGWPMLPNNLSRSVAHFFQSCSTSLFLVNLLCLKKRRAGWFYDFFENNCLNRLINSSLAYYFHWSFQSDPEYWNDTHCVELNNINYVLDTKIYHKTSGVKFIVKLDFHYYYYRNLWYPTTINGIQFIMMVMYIIYYYIQFKPCKIKTIFD